MDLNTLREYIQIHKISLEQDYNKIPDGDLDTWCHLNGQIYAVNHILGVING